MCQGTLCIFATSPLGSNRGLLMRCAHSPAMTTSPAWAWAGSRRGQQCQERARRQRCARGRTPLQACAQGPLIPEGCAHTAQPLNTGLSRVPAYHSINRALTKKYLQTITSLCYLTFLHAHILKCRRGMLEACVDETCVLALEQSAGSPTKA